MTTYNTIANADIDQDSPITSQLMTYLRDNPIAITEGSSGAPTIQTAAIADGAVTVAKMSSGPAMVTATTTTGQSTTLSWVDYLSTTISVQDNNSAYCFAIVKFAGVNSSDTIKARLTIGGTAVNEGDVLVGATTDADIYDIFMFGSKDALTTGATAVAIQIIDTAGGANATAGGILAIERPA